WVAFKTDQAGVPALGIVHTTAPNSEAVLQSGVGLTRFVWAPDSSGLYYQDGSAVYYTRTQGGTPRLVGTLTGLAPILHDIDSAGTLLIGTRSPKVGDYSVFTFPTSGATAAVDIVQTTGYFLSSVAIDPSGKKIAYTSQASGFPHLPIDVRMVDVDGKNDVSLTGGPIPNTAVSFSLPRDLVWADAGQTLLFTAIDPASFTWQVARVTTASPLPQALTGGPGFHADTGVSKDRSTVVYRAITAHNYQVAGVCPAIGGGRVLLEPELDWNFTGKPSTDRTGFRVAFAGYLVGSMPGTRAEIQLIELDREIKVAPLPRLGASVTLELPVALNEQGTLFLSTGLLHPDPTKGPTLIPIPGLVYKVALNPAVLIPVLAGVGDGKGPLSLNATVPNDPALNGFTVYLQGLRVKSSSPLSGDLTRYVELQFFQ
ncbi:MAG: hypothetical protein KDC87_06980, partial [Planctomycetes bacterium]|nr:hypothetical protein [Planctomycetota bacterium]